MKIIRTFHSIGQGAFYSERHFINDKEFTIIYDCGSATLKAEKLKTKINSVFPKGHTIDILFISHLHSDHINGIEFLKKNYTIKSVVLPYINDDTKILLKISNYLIYGDSKDEIIDNPNKYFGSKTKVILVDEAVIDLQSNGVDLQTIKTISNLRSSNSIQSGSVIVSGVMNYKWYFIPFNYKDDVRKKQFLVFLKKVSLSLSDLNTLEKVITHKVKLRKIYNSIDRNLNVNSLILFSGKDSTLETNCYTEKHHLFSPHFFNKIDSGCIYFGDINLNQKDIVEDIECKLVKVLPYVGIIQVPHHGSVLSFDKSVLAKFKNIKCAVFSFGTTNTYGHPSESVISEILSNSIFPYLVTEERDSTLIQWNEIFDLKKIKNIIT